MPPEVRREQPLHVAAEIAVAARPEHKMKVVRHQTDVQQPHGDAIVRAKQKLDEGRVAPIGVADLHAGTAAIDDVVADAADGGASGSWDVGTLAGPAVESKSKVECPYFSGN